MATTTKGIYYPNDGTKAADILADLKKMAETIDDNFKLDGNNITSIQNLLKDIASSDLTNKNNISNLQSRTTALETDNTQNKSDISTLKSDNQTNKSNISSIQSLMKEMAASDLTNKNNITNLQNKVTSLETDNTQNKTNIENNTNKNIEQDELISKLRNAALNAETEESKSIHVEDANKFGSLEVLGNHEQKTREGYNILDYLPNIRSSINGLTVNKDEETGYITVNGTPTANYTNISQFDNAFVQKFVDSLEDGQTYTIWQQNYGSYASGVYLQIQQTDKNSGAQTNIEASNTKKTFIVNKTLYNYTVSLQTGTIAQAGTFTNYKNRYMIYKGTDSKEFELYGASPSPDHPSSVKCLEGSVKIINLNKNKFIPLPTGNNSGLAITKNEDGTYNVSGTATARIEHTAFVDLEESGIENGLTYILSSTKTLPEGVTSRVEMYNGASWLRAFVPNITSTIATNTGTANTTDATRVRFGIFIASGTTINIRNLGFQLEEGTVATDFVERKQTDYLLYIQQEMPKRDYFVKESDGWKEVHLRNKRNIKNDIQNAVLSSSGNFIYVSALLSNTAEIPAHNGIDMNVISNIAEHASYSAIENKLTDYGIGISNAGSLTIRIKDCSTLEEYKELLDDNSFYYYYYLATPTKLPCTKEQSAVLEELNNMDLFEGVNNIITAEDIALLKLKYALDVETYVDNKLNTINQQILNIAGGN